jgi:hypothetical protein
MDVLNNEMRNTLARKLLFNLNFMMITHENLFDKFNLSINDAIENKVVRFDLIRKNASMYISFKRLSNDEFTVEVHGMNKDNGTTDVFVIYVNRDSDFEEYYNCIMQLFNIVTEKARIEQFERMEASINELLK